MRPPAWPPWYHRPVDRRQAPSLLYSHGITRSPTGRVCDPGPWRCNRGRDAAPAVPLSTEETKRLFGPTAWSQFRILHQPSRRGTHEELERYLSDDMINPQHRVVIEYCVP